MSSVKQLTVTTASTAFTKALNNIDVMDKSIKANLGNIDTIATRFTRAGTNPVSEGDRESARPCNVHVNRDPTSTVIHRNLFTFPNTEASEFDTAGNSQTRTKKLPTTAPPPIHDPETSNNQVMFKYQGLEAESSDAKAELDLLKENLLYLRTTLEPFGLNPGNLKVGLTELFRKIDALRDANAKHARATLELREANNELKNANTQLKESNANLCKKVSESELNIQRQTADMKEQTNGARSGLGDLIIQPNTTVCEDSVKLANVIVEYEHSVSELKQRNVELEQVLHSTKLQSTQLGNSVVGWKSIVDNLANENNSLRAEIASLKSSSPTETTPTDEDSIVTAGVYRDVINDLKNINASLLAEISRYETHCDKLINESQTSIAGSIELEKKIGYLEQVVRSLADERNRLGIENNALRVQAADRGIPAAGVPKKPRVVELEKLYYSINSGNEADVRKIIEKNYNMVKYSNYTFAEIKTDLFNIIRREIDLINRGVM